MDPVSARRLMSQLLRPILRPDQQYDVTPTAKSALDQNRDGKISSDELLQGLVRDDVSFDPRIREIIANRSRLDLDASVVPSDKSSSYGTVEQCMEFVQRYYLEAREHVGLMGPSFDVDFGLQHNLAGEVRQLAAGQSQKPGYQAYLNGGLTPPRAGDVLSAESPDGEEFHVALVAGVDKVGDRWEVTVYEANVPYGQNSKRIQDHLEKLTLDHQDGRWKLTAFQTAKAGYDANMDVVGWIHPEASKALPGAAR